MATLLVRVFLLQEECGANLICRAEAIQRNIARDFLSFFQSVLDNWIPIALIALVIALLLYGYKQVKDGVAWRDLAEAFWTRYIVPIIVVLVAAGAVLVLVVLFPDIFGRVGDAVRNLLGF